LQTLKYFKLSNFSAAQSRG
jgi:hypothetical protein